MRKQSHTTGQDFPVRQGAYDRYVKESGTGGMLIESPSKALYVLAPRMWNLLRVDPRAYANSATTGVDVVFVKVSSEFAGVLPSFGCKQEATLPVLSLPAIPAVVLSPASVVDMVRVAFGLNVSETAEVFGVTRQTVYQWMKLGDLELVRAKAYRERIKAIYQVAKAWQDNPPLTGRWQEALLPSGRTVLDLLKAPQIDLAALQEAHTLLAASTQGRRREEGERTKRALQGLAKAFTQMAQDSLARKAKT